MKNATQKVAVIEYVLFGTKKGDEDWKEVVITAVEDTPEGQAKLEKAKAWAESQGFDRLRVHTDDFPPRTSAQKVAVDKLFGTVHRDASFAYVETADGQKFELKEPDDAGVYLSHEVYFEVNDQGKAYKLEGTDSRGNPTSGSPYRQSHQKIAIDSATKSYFETYFLQYGAQLTRDLAFKKVAHRIAQASGHIRGRIAQADGRLRERIAEALGWTVEATQSVSFQSLRDLVRPVSPELAAEISRAIESGSYIRQAQGEGYSVVMGQLAELQAAHPDWEYKDAVAFLLNRAARYTPEFEALSDLYDQCNATGYEAKQAQLPEAVSLRVEKVEGGYLYPFSLLHDAEMFAEEHGAKAPPSTGGYSGYYEVFVPGEKIAHKRAQVIEEPNKWVQISTTAWENDYSDGAHGTVEAPISGETGILKATCVLSDGQTFEDSFQDLDRAFLFCNNMVAAGVGQLSMQGQTNEVAKAATQYLKAEKAAQSLDWMQQPDEAVKAKVKELWTRGKSLREIGDEMGLDVEVHGGISDMQKNVMEGNIAWGPKGAIE